MAGLVHVKDLPIEVSCRQEVLSLERGFELGEDLIEVLLEAGPCEKVEHSAGEEQGDHLGRRQRDGLPASCRHQAPDLASANDLLVQGLVGASKGVQVTERGLGADLEPL